MALVVHCSVPAGSFWRGFSLHAAANSSGSALPSAFMLQALDMENKEGSWGLSQFQARPSFLFFWVWHDVASISVGKDHESDFFMDHRMVITTPAAPAVSEWRQFSSGSVVASLEDCATTRRGQKRATGTGRNQGLSTFWHPKNRNIWKKNPTWPRIMGIFILRLYEIGMEAHESQLLSGTVGTSLELMRSFLNLVEKSTWKSWYSAGPFLWPQSIPAPEPLSIHLLDEEHLTRCPSGCHVAADSLSLEFLMDVYPLVNQHDELENHQF